MEIYKYKKFYSRKYLDFKDRLNYLSLQLSMLLCIFIRLLSFGFIDTSLDSHFYGKYFRSLKHTK